jgi:hypothetical protein
MTMESAARRRPLKLRHVLLTALGSCLLILAVVVWALAGAPVLLGALPRLVRSAVLISAGLGFGSVGVIGLARRRLS